MTIALVYPNITHQQSYYTMVNEFLENNEKVIPTAMEIKDQEIFDEFLVRQDNNRDGINLPLGRVPSSLYFIVDTKSNTLLGGIHIRHHLNDALKIAAGHIGYGIRPSERKNGYATLALQLAILEARKLGITDIMLTCNKENLGSAKVIQNNGGVLDSEYLHDGVMLQKWWIK